MDNRPIGILDSGVGGLSVLYELDKKLKGEKFIYLGDNGNNPYGTKSLNQLYDISLINIRILKRYNLKALVLACNTLSVNLIKEIQSVCDFNVFGVYPPVNNICKKENTLLMCTPKTAEKYFYKESEYFTVLPMPTLASEIEKHVDNLDLLDINNLLISSFNDKGISEKKYFDNVILGCTHYEFVKYKIFDHFKPKNIISGNDLTVKRVCNYVKKHKLSDIYLRNEILFIGDFSNFNEIFYKKVVENNTK